MRTFIIGDVHGNIGTLRNLVNDLNPRYQDRFAFVGDLVDKGKSSVAVIRHVKLLMLCYPGSVTVAGNHESKAIERYLKDGTDHHRFEPWAKETNEDDWEFLLSLPLYARFPELNVLIVHGGLYPRFFDLYPEGLDDDRLLSKPWHKGGGKYTKRAKRFLYTRHVDPETGNNVLLGEETNLTKHWSELYDGREGLVFYGHDPQMNFEPKVTEHSIGVDTAVVYPGGRLTAAVLHHDKDGPLKEITYASVPGPIWENAE